MTSEIGRQLRQKLKDALAARVQRFSNPYHDEDTGRFTDGPEGIKRPTPPMANGGGAKSSPKRNNINDENDMSPLGFFTKGLAKDLTDSLTDEMLDTIDEDFSGLAVKLRSGGFLDPKKTDHALYRLYQIEMADILTSKYLDLLTEHLPLSGKKLKAPGEEGQPTFFYDLPDIGVKLGIAINPNTRNIHTTFLDGLDRRQAYNKVVEYKKRANKPVVADLIDTATLRGDK